MKKKPFGKLVGAQRKKKCVFYLSGISLESSNDDIISFCENQCPVIDCRVMSLRRNGTLSARIVISEENTLKLEQIECTISLPSTMEIRQGRHPRSSFQRHHLNTSHIISNAHMKKGTTAALKKPKIYCPSHPDTTHVLTQSNSEGTHPTITNK